MSIESENEQLREEVVMVECETRRLHGRIAELQAEVERLRRTPAIPESAIRAVWIDGYNTGQIHSRRDEHSGYDTFAGSSDMIAALFTDMMKRG